MITCLSYSRAELIVRRARYCCVVNIPGHTDSHRQHLMPASLSYIYILLLHVRLAQFGLCAFLSTIQVTGNILVCFLKNHVLQISFFDNAIVVRLLLFPSAGFLEMRVENSCSVYLWSSAAPRALMFAMRCMREVLMPLPASLLRGLRLVCPSPLSRWVPLLS
jgi:hypothetical protein